MRGGSSLAPPGACMSATRVRASPRLSPGLVRAALAAATASDDRTRKKKKKKFVRGMLNRPNTNGADGLVQPYDATKPLDDEATQPPNRSRTRSRGTALATGPRLEKDQMAGEEGSD